MPNSAPRVLVLLNRRSGTLANSSAGDEAARIIRGFADRGVQVDLRSVDPSRLTSTVASATSEGFTAVIAGGGDGTINTIANAVAGTKLSFGVVPLGTHNHFAKDIGVPADLDSAVARLGDAIQRGAEPCPLDVGEVNGHLFLNFSGIGLHPEMVEQRDEEHKQIKRWPLLRAILKRFTKPLAMLVAFIRSLGRLSLLRLVIEADGKRFSRITPMVIIGNNVSQMAACGIEDVSVLRRDVLNMYVARTLRIQGLIRLLLGALFRRLRSQRQFEALAVRDLTIRHRRPTLKVSVDGEVIQLRTPLRYRIRQGALMMIK